MSCLQSPFAAGSRYLRKLAQTLHRNAEATSALATKPLQMISLKVMMLISIVCKILSYKQSKKEKNIVTDAPYRSICFSPLEKVPPVQTEYDFFGLYTNQALDLY